MKKKVTLSPAQKEYFINIQSKQYDIVSYLSIEDIINSLNELDYHAYALCTHDKDIDVNQCLKKSHTHIVLVLEKRCRATRLIRLFNTTEVRKINTARELKGSFNYLTHETENAIKSGKYIYPKSSRLVINEDYFNNLTDMNFNSLCLDIIDSINNGSTHRELISRFGKDFVVNYKSYKMLADIVACEENYPKINLTEVQNENR